MREHTDKAILVVSFGTSHHDTRALTIDAIERDIQAAFGSTEFTGPGQAR